MSGLGFTPSRGRAMTRAGFGRASSPALHQSGVILHFFRHSHRSSREGNGTVRESNALHRRTMQCYCIKWLRYFRLFQTSRKPGNHGMSGFQRKSAMPKRDTPYDRGCACFSDSGPDDRTPSPCRRSCRVGRQYGKPKQSAKQPLPARQARLPARIKAIFVCSLSSRNYLSCHTLSHCGYHGNDK